MEYASFGDVTTYYEGLDVALQQKVGDVFSAWPSGLVNWLEVIRRFRNICAHQGRIWNRKINTRLKYNFSNLADYPEVQLAAMGFPSDWQTLALWQ